MKMDYASNNCEGRARELLAPLTGVCPDSVWENVSTDLDARRREMENKWVNKINNVPKMPLLAAAAIAVISISAWMFFSHRDNTLSASTVSISNISEPKKNTNTIASQQPVVKKDTAVKMLNSLVTDPPAQSLPSQNSSVSLTKVNQPVKNQVVQSNVQNTQMQASKDDKDDGRPILIQHDASDPQVITSDQQPSKGVAIDLGGNDNSAPHATMSPSSAEAGPIQDSTAQ
ncbi:MAG TPA: hypothetical protein VK783_04825 [Bacteroidia bacterium]|nr:hypothetical protein [Bacteroidia bacterium]